MESRKHSRDWDHERPLEGHGITKKDESRLDNSEGGGDEDIVPQIFRNGRIRSNSLGEVSVEGNGKKKGSKPNSISPMGKRRITWADGTAEPRQSQLAVTIPRHRNTSEGYTIYIVELWYDGRSWSIKRRFSDFYEFHQELLLEYWDRPILLPELPTKAWLNVRLWFNKFDEDFLFRRRQQLQEYLRALVKIDNIVENSCTLQQFLEINPSSPSLRSKSMTLSRSIDRPHLHLLQSFNERHQSEEESVEGGKISFFGPNQYIYVDPNTSHIA